MSKEIYLLLADGTVFTGKSFGAVGDTLGEVVFTTGIVGYLETLTDPSYYGQIVVQTFPLIGNYGVIPADFESDASHIKGYIVREWCETPSNFRSEGDIDSFLKENNIIGLYDIDTRALTRKLRAFGVMNGMITADLSDKEAKLEKIRSYTITESVESTTTTEITTYPAEEKKYKVGLWDFGAKHNIIKELNRRGCEVVCLPAHTSAEEIAKLNLDGIMLSNGPGDPADNTEIIAEIGKVASSGMAICGICLGHQLLALSQGAKTKKLKYGHRGGNQPVRNLTDGSICITSQNHGYAVDETTLPPHAKLLYENVNDKTCEGVQYDTFPGFSVQFHPEAAAGPKDSAFLFDDFLHMIATVKGGK